MFYIPSISLFEGLKGLTSYISEQTTSAYEKIASFFHKKISTIPSVILSDDPTAANPLRRRSITVPNSLEGAHKYIHALIALDAALDEHLKGKGQTMSSLLTTLEDRAKTAGKNSIDHHLYHALKALTDPNKDVRDRYRLVTDHLRNAIESKEYKAHQQGLNFTDEAEVSDSISLIQLLCKIKFTGVYPHESFQQMIDKATGGAPDEAALTKDNIAKTITDKNKALGKLSWWPSFRSWWPSSWSWGSDLKKNGVAIGKQCLENELGIHSDPQKRSNVANVRTLRTMSDGRTLTSCRIGTPTIQKWWFSEAKIDPMFSSAIEGMKQEGKTFLYVNHQKPTGQEGKRSDAIAALQKEHDNFHFLSIPLDGEIIKGLNPDKMKFDDLKQLIIDSYLYEKNGCKLPDKILKGKRPLETLKMRMDFLNNILERVQTNYFADVEMDFFDSKENREAFWAIFNSELKEDVIAATKADYLNSACKDNIDRGGTLSSVDEAILNLKLGLHGHSGALKGLYYNVLSPFAVKTKAILDDPTKPDKHRLGYLRSVLNRIAQLPTDAVDKIQKNHEAQPVHVVQQIFPTDRGAKVASDAEIKIATSPSATRAALLNGDDGS